MKLKRNRKRGIDDIISDIRAEIKKTEPAADVEFIQVLQDMIGDLTSQPEPVVIKLFSPDGKLLNATAPKVAEAIQKIPHVVDVLDGIENSISGPAVTYQVNPAVAARSGFALDEVAVDAAAVLEGEPAATPVVLNDRLYTIRVRFPEQSRASLDRMGNTLLTSATGKTATLASLATITTDPGQTEIRRENLQRLVEVTARFEGVDLGSGMASIQKTVADMHLPSSIRVEYGGLYEEQQKSFHDLLMVFLLALVLVFVVLLFEFRTFSAPLAILGSALLSTFGGFLALLVTNTTFNVASFMGMIMVIGIDAKNGILLLDAVAFPAARLHSRRIHDPGRPSPPPPHRQRTALAANSPACFPSPWPSARAPRCSSPWPSPSSADCFSSIVLSLVFTPTINFYLDRLSGTRVAVEN